MHLIYSFFWNDVNIVGLVESEEVALKTIAWLEKNEPEKQFYSVPIRVKSFEDVRNEEEHPPYLIGVGDSMP